MKKKQMSYIVTGNWNYATNSSAKEWGDDTEELNGYLEAGWKVISATPMGAYSFKGKDTHWADSGFASLVILEKEE